MLAPRSARAKHSSNSGKSHGIRNTASGGDCFQFTLRVSNGVARKRTQHEVESLVGIYDFGEPVGMFGHWGLLNHGVVGIDAWFCSHFHGFGFVLTDSDCWLGCCVAWEENHVFLDVVSRELELELEMSACREVELEPYLSIQQHREIHRRWKRSYSL
ncbi:hypothetical protein Tco_0340813 [Tanacetum coccineum]